MSDLLELGRDGLVLGGKPWVADRPFLAVIGNPVAHSLSPAMHTAALAERDLDRRYLPCLLRDGEIPRFKELTAGGHLVGFNVTAPFKEAFVPHCEELTETADRLGAVNTVRIAGDGRWIGHNTDSGGLLVVLSQAWKIADPPAQATVLGAGGAARAAVDALRRWGVPEIAVRTRSKGTRDRFRAWVAGLGDPQGIVVEDLLAGVQQAPVVPSVWICSLPAGVPVGEYLPVAAGSDPALLVDFRYKSQLPPEPAPLGFDRVDGLPILLMQGGLAFAWWFGPPVPWTAMRGALEG